MAQNALDSSFHFIPFPFLLVFYSFILAGREVINARNHEVGLVLYSTLVKFLAHITYHQWVHKRDVVGHINRDISIRRNFVLAHFAAGPMWGENTNQRSSKQVQWQNKRWTQWFVVSRLMKDNAYLQPEECNSMAKRKRERVHRFTHDVWFLLLKRIPNAQCFSLVRNGILHCLWCRACVIGAFLMQPNGKEAV